MLFLKQSTSGVLKIGPFIDDTDGKTAETLLTLGSSDIRLSKNGGDIAAKNSTVACTHDELGYYNCTITATDTNTVGKLQLFVHETGALPVFHEYTVVNPHVYNSLFSSSGADYLTVDTVQWASTGTAVTDVAIKASVELSATSLDAVKNRATTALEAISLNHFISVTAGAEKPVTGSYLDSILYSSSSQSFNRTTDSLQAVRDRGDAAWTTATTVHISTTGVDSIMDEVISEAAHTTVNSLGWLVRKIAYIIGHTKINVTDATGAIAVRNAADAADLWTGTVTDNSVTTVRTKLSS